MALAQAAEDTSDADETTIRHRVRAEVVALGCLSEFLTDAEITVVGLGFDRFVDAVEEQFGRMLAASRRREHVSGHVPLAGGVTGGPPTTPQA